jgi:hypothetical protein
MFLKMKSNAKIFNWIRRRNSSGYWVCFSNECNYISPFNQLNWMVLMRSHLVHFAALGTKQALSTVAVVRSGHPIVRRFSQITRLLWFKFQPGLTSPLWRFVRTPPPPPPVAWIMIALSSSSEKVAMLTELWGKSKNLRRGKNVFD